MRCFQMTTLVMPQIIYCKLHSPEIHHFSSSESDSHDLGLKQLILHHLQSLQCVHVQSLRVCSWERIFSVTQVATLENLQHGETIEN